MLPQLTVGSEGRVKILGLSYLILDKSYCTLVFKRGMWQNEMTFLHWIETQIFSHRLKRKAISFFPRFYFSVLSNFVFVKDFCEVANFPFLFKNLRYIVQFTLKSHFEVSSRIVFYRKK